MRFLLDEQVPEKIALVFRGLRHEAGHVRMFGLGGVPDAQVAKAAREFDVLGTLDLHRQER